ncbi:MAG: flagellar motor protein MotB [bacterium]
MIRKEKKEKGYETAGGLRWLITYADMITLLLGVFIILVGTMAISEKRFKEMKRGFSKVFSTIKEEGRVKISSIFKREAKREKILSISKGGREKNALFNQRETRIAGVSVFNQRYIEDLNLL